MTTRSVLGRVVRSTVLGGILWVTLMSLTAIQRSILFPRDAIPPAPDTAHKFPELVRLDVTHEDGRSEGWFLPGDGVSADDPGPAVIFGHGNAELIDYNAALLRPYRDMGISVALLEYRGYGRSDGEPSQEAITEDLLAFRALVIARPEVDAERLIYHGRSLGGGAVCALAAHHPPRVMILESTFRSVKVMARKFLLPGFLVADPFDNEAVLRELEVPVLVFHGTDDDLIPFDHGEKLAEVAPNAKLVPYPCGHNDFPPSPQHYWDQIRQHVEPLLDEP